MRETASKYPISDSQMTVLLSKYPFLKHINIWATEKEFIYNTEKENLEYNWYKIWDGHGWERLWKHYFMPRLFKLYDSWDDEKKSKFYFVYTKSKFGSLRLSTSFTLPDDMEWILEWMSEFICENCGAEPKDEQGHRIIYETSGWISHLCEDCLRKLYKSNIDLMREDEVEKGIDGMKRVALSFGYKRTSPEGSIVRRFKYNEEGDWLVLDREYTEREEKEND